VLSAGGMFGAYQAGAWSVLADCFEPDFIVGASVGAINAWCIAGGCAPEQLIQNWLTLDCAATYRWQIPRAIHGGLLDCRPLMARVDEIYASYRPKVDCAVVITELAGLRPRIIRGSEVTADVLRASTAIFGIFEQVRIGGRVCTDGGTLAALPVWAAAELGAERVIAVNALPGLPGLIPKMFVAVVRRVSRFRPVAPQGLEVIRIAPPGLLGSGLDALYWSREKAERWVEQGRRDALAQKHSIENCFERK
jgi:predicted acylesterase/phospholipase RssA